MNDLNAAFLKYADELVAFAQALVRIPSFSDCEGSLAACVRDEMLALGYDEVFTDRTGNVVGRMGSGGRSAADGGRSAADGGKTVLFDSHMDTVRVTDADLWANPPFSGAVIDGMLHGRGSVDMKSALAAAVYAAALARDLGLLQERTVYVTGTVCEEFCDGENLKMLFAEHPEIKPDYVVICEPSNNLITLGHKGKAQIRLRTHGVSAHGSAPEKGVNAVYEMAEIIQRVEALNHRLSAADGPHGTGTIVLSDISCVSASLNAVPDECAIYLDRRLVLGETEDDVRAEMDALIAGKNADWEIGVLEHTSWTGAAIHYAPLHRAWRIDPEHALTQACNRAYETVFDRKPTAYEFWDFGTNAVTPVAMGIPVIGFGPGEYKLAHMRDERCSVAQIQDACRFYAAVVGNL